MKCSKCNKEMVLRTQRASGDLFWGCSGYPVCKNTQRYVDEADDISKIPFDPTPEQAMIFSHIDQHVGNLIIQAVAGSGKTTTILQALRYVPKDSKAVFLAFNKAIAESLSKRAPSHVEVRTLHSLGLKFIRRKIDKVTVDNDKISNILHTTMAETDFKKFGSMVERVYGLIASNDMSLSIDSVKEVMDYYNIGDDVFSADSIFYALKPVPHEDIKQIEQSGIVSFDNLIIYPSITKGVCSTYDYVFVDECQDLNKAQIAFILNLIGPKTITVCVGDRNQSIYGFRGADTQAMDFLKAALNATELPLSTCFRCPVVHLTMAQKIVPMIQPRPNAPDGEVYDLNLNDLLAKAEKEDLVISRLNAPLLPIALKFIRANKAAYVKGRDIAANILTMLDAVKDKDQQTATEILVDRANKKAQSLTEKNKLAQAANVLDLCACALFFINNYETIAEGINSVYTLFDEQNGGIALSSIHKAKGLEASRVFIINYDSMPMNTRLPWEKQQEKNLMYVALTRSRQYLGLVHVQV